MKDELPPMPLRQRVEMRMTMLGQIQQTHEQIQQTQQQLSDLIQIVTQATQQLTGMMNALMQAISAPRRRVPIRDAEGRITEAHDMPMGMQ